MQTLCHVGASIDPFNRQMCTPLHAAAKEGHIEVVRCLCVSNADITLMDGEVNTADVSAQSKGHNQVHSLLTKIKSVSIITLTI